MTSGPLSRGQVLDELEFLATVEHALIVEYLSLCCALGHNLDAEEGGATTTQGREAADTASALAQSQMFHLKDVNHALVAAGRSAQLARAASISSATVAEIPLAPPTRAQLERFVDREEAIAAAVDERYTRLRPAVTTAPVFEGDLLTKLRSVIVDDGPTHAAAVAGLRTSLGDLAPASCLRATRREAADAFEQRLLDISDHSYGLVLTALQQQFLQKDSFVSATFRLMAVSVMMGGLDLIHHALVQRGLLPPFTIS